MISPQGSVLEIVDLFGDEFPSSISEPLDGPRQKSTVIDYHSMKVVAFDPFPCWLEHVELILGTLSKAWSSLAQNGEIELGVLA